ncbi:MAG: hypothetical protein AAF492_24850, partial [Verrucomicrobiota bacterium]
MKRPDELKGKSTFVAQATTGIKVVRKTVRCFKTTSRSRKIATTPTIQTAAPANGNTLLAQNKRWVMGKPLGMGTGRWALIAVFGALLAIGAGGLLAWVL